MKTFRALQYLVLFLTGVGITFLASTAALGQTEDDVRQLQQQYGDCIKEASAQYLVSNTSAGDVADAALSRCERALSRYEVGTRAYFILVQSNSVESATRANQMARTLASELRDRARAQTIRLIIDARSEADKNARITNASPSEQKSKPKEPKKPEKSSGTGFFVSGDGYLITNEHVVSSCTALNAIDAAGQKIPIQVIRVLKSDDLALLKSNTAPKSFAAFRGSARINQGEAVVAYGYPLAGLLASEGNVSTGLVTALAGLGDDARQMQISAPVQPGNSGGPLVDSKGLVIGVVVSKLDAIAVSKITSDIPQNINFAIKFSSVINLLDLSSVKYRSGNLQRDLPVETLTQQVKRYTVKIECN